MNCFYSLPGNYFRSAGALTVLLFVFSITSGQTLNTSLGEAEYFGVLGGQDVQSTSPVLVQQAAGSNTNVGSGIIATGGIFSDTACITQKPFKL